MHDMAYTSLSDATWLEARHVNEADSLGAGIMEADDRQVTTVFTV